jgi:two-component system sensor histidine kinase KdpD
MSRIEAGALTLDRQPCEVETLVWEGLRQAGVRPEHGRVRVRVPETLPEISAERGLAGLALANLLSNALKYSPPQSVVDVDARLSADGRLVAVWVDDCGPGIVAGEAERIFEPFYRGGAAHAHGRQGPTGTGLGLSIARALVEAHGGRLWVEGRPGGGSRFTATWPVVHSDVPAQADGAGQ